MPSLSSCIGRPRFSKIILYSFEEEFLRRRCDGGKWLTTESHSVGVDIDNFSDRVIKMAINSVNVSQIGVQ